MATSKTIYDPRRYVPTTSTDTDAAVPVTNASNLGFVALQPASPGTAQTGVANITKLLVGPVGDGTTPVAVTTDGGNAATFGNGATTGGIQLFISNSGGNIICGVNDSLNTFISGGTAYGGFIGTNIGKPVDLIVNGTSRLTIDTSGNVSVNGANASYRLHASATGQRTFGINRSETTGVRAFFDLVENGTARFGFGLDGSSHLTVRNGTYATECLNADASGNLSVGPGALATTATDGFLYIPSCAGTPTGTPTAKTGFVPVVYDSTNNKMYVYNGAWKSATFA